jgi:3-dehydroquinate dehydratase
MEDINCRLSALAAEKKASLRFFQSNTEGAIVDFIQQNMDVEDS